jgi:hypothetical protein
MQSECVYGAEHLSAAAFCHNTRRDLVSRCFVSISRPLSADSNPLLKKLLDGNIQTGTLGALSIELLAHISQVGFEPTSSRASGEVTLFSTTSNLVASRH